MTLPIFFTIFIGDDVDQMLQFLENGLGVDLTAATAIELYLLKPDGSTPLYLTASLANSKIVVPVGTQGLARLVLAQADTELLKEICEPADFDAVVTIGGKEKTYRFVNSVLVSKRKGP